MMGNSTLKPLDTVENNLSRAFFTTIISISFITFFYLLSVGFGGPKISKNGEILIYFIFFLAAPIFGVITAKADSYFGYNLLQNSVAKKVLTALSILMPASIVLWALSGISRSVYHTWAEVPDTSTMRFTVGVISILGLLASAFAYKKLVDLAQNNLVAYLDKAAKLLFFIVGCGIIFLLLDVNITFETLSYAAYIGPVMEVLNNKLPLVDVYSQYGLNYLLFILVYKFLPWSLYSASLVVAALNLLYYYAIIFTTVKLAQQKTFTFFCIVLSVLFLHAASLYNVTFTPSVLAMRFLPSVLLALAITFIPNRRSFTIFSILATALCSLWSLECFMLAFGINAAYHAMYLMANKKPGIKPFYRNCLKTVACLLIPYIAIYMYYLLVLHVTPDFKPYFELLQAQKTPDAAWILPTDPKIRTWAFFGLTYGIGLAYATFSAWRCNPTNDSRIRRLACIAAVSVLGIGQFSYYACRSTTPILVIIAFPMAILFSLFMDDVYQNYKSTNKLSSVNITYGLFGIVMLGVMGGVFADRFFRPMTTLSSNSTILRACFLPGNEKLCSPAGIFNLYKGFLTPLASYPKSEQIYGFVPDPDENEAAYYLIKKWQPNEKRVSLFILDNFTVLFQLKKLHRLELAHTMVDGLSPTLAERALKRADGLQAGEILYIGNVTRSVVDRKVIDFLKTKWTFCHLESRGVVNEARIAALGGGGIMHAFRLQELGSKCGAPMHE